MTEPNDLQQRYREFLDLMPLAVALAGLPTSDSGKYYTDAQIESRVITLRHAYKQARLLAREFIKQ
jgi:hypothetical protein